LTVGVPTQRGGVRRTAEGKATAVIVKEHEDEKQRTYGAACQAKGHKFIPFVWTTGGVIGQSAMKLINKLAERLGERWHRPKGRCKEWIKGQIALAIARSTIVLAFVMYVAASLRLPTIFRPLMGLLSLAG
jgi:hypothetical protein